MFADICANAMCVCLVATAGCRLEGSLDKVGSRLLDQLDKTPIELVEVNEPVSAPPGLPADSELDQPVIPVDTPPAQYPDRLRRKSVEGKASVFFIVDTSGTIIAPHIEYATDTSFARALLETVQTWRVQPGLNDGRPVRCYKRLTIDFALR